MNYYTKNKLFVFGYTCFACCFCSVLFAQSNDKTYYDAFYEEYYNSFPKKDPKNASHDDNNSVKKYNKLSLSGTPVKKDKIKSNLNNQQFQMPSNWDSIYYNEAMRYWEYKTSNIRLDLAYQNISSQFEFEMQVGSILKWDRLNGSQLKAVLSKDFYIANKQYVGNFEYKKGSVTSDYTLDDDLWNELHIFSAGKGDGKLSDMKASIGMRNYFRFFGWNITPGIGVQKKNADLRMINHGQPVPFFLNCKNPETNDFNEEVCSFVEGLNTYYVKNGTLIPEGDMEVYTDKNCRGTPERFYFDHSKYMTHFRGYSQVNKINGVSHYYNVGWFGPFLSLDLEKIISIREGLLFKFEVFYPKYKARGVWPNREEWKDFYDQGGMSLGYSFSALYTMKITPSVGLYGSFITDYIMSKNMDTIINHTDGEVEALSKEIKRAEWKSTIIEVGLKYLF